MPLRICKTIGPQGASGSGQVVFGDGVWALSLGLAVYCGSDLAFAWRLSLGAVPGSVAACAWRGLPGRWARWAQSTLRRFGSLPSRRVLKMVVSLGCRRQAELASPVLAKRCWCV